MTGLLFSLLSKKEVDFLCKSASEMSWRYTKAMFLLARHMRCDRNALLVYEDLVIIPSDLAVKWGVVDGV